MKIGLSTIGTYVFTDEALKWVANCGFSEIRVEDYTIADVKRSPIPVRISVLDRNQDILPLVKGKQKQLLERLYPDKSARARMILFYGLLSGDGAIQNFAIQQLNNAYSTNAIIQLFNGPEYWMWMSFSSNLPHVKRYTGYNYANLPKQLGYWDISNWNKCYENIQWLFAHYKYNSVHVYYYNDTLHFSYDGDLFQAVFSEVGVSKNVSNRADKFDYVLKFIQDKYSPAVIDIHNIVDPRFKNLTDKSYLWDRDKYLQLLNYYNMDLLEYDGLIYDYKIIDTIIKNILS